MNNWEAIIPCYYTLNSATGLADMDNTTTAIICHHLCPLLTNERTSLFFLLSTLLLLETLVFVSALVLFCLFLSLSQIEALTCYYFEIIWVPVPMLTDVCTLQTNKYKKTINKKIYISVTAPKITDLLCNFFWHSREQINYFSSHEHLLRCLLGWSNLLKM